MLNLKEYTKKVIKRYKTYTKSKAKQYRPYKEL